MATTVPIQTSRFLPGVLLAVEDASPVAPKKAKAVKESEPTPTPTISKNGLLPAKKKSTKPSKKEKTEARKEEDAAAAAPAEPAAAPQQAPTDAKDEKDGAKKERVIKPLTPGCARPVMIHRASKYFLVNL